MNVSAFHPGDLVRVEAHPPVAGEVLATCPERRLVRVRFRNGAEWLPEACLRLLASGDERSAA